MPLCEQCHGADVAEQQVSRLTSSGCERSVDVPFFGAGLGEAPGRDSPNIHWKFEVARQASSRSLCASVRAVPWEDEAEQQLSRLATSGCKLSADIRILKAGLTKEPDKDAQIYS